MKKPNLKKLLDLGWIISDKRTVFSNSFVLKNGKRRILYDPVTDINFCEYSTYSSFCKGSMTDKKRGDKHGKV